MATKTNFLELTLPDNGEYVDNWDTVVNANFEDIDEYADELNEELVGTTGNITNLKGTAASVQDRLDAGLNSDGTLDLDGASDFTNLENSKHYGVSAASDQGQRVLDRLHFVENDMIACRFGELSDRYGETTTPETIAGLSKIAGAHEAFGTTLPSGELVPSVIRGFTPNSVVDGPRTASAPYRAQHVTTGGLQNLTLGGGTPTTPTVYNIDGMWFEIADAVSFLIGTGGHDSLSNTTQYSVWASRNESDYNTSGNLQWYYDQWCGLSLGAAYQLDLRIVPTHSGLIANAGSTTNPSDGSISVSTPTQITSATAANYSLIRAGDILVISSPSYLAGEYLISSASGTAITIFGTFQVTATQSGITFHVERRTMPALGFTETATAESSPTAGRVVIGDFATDGNVPPTVDVASVTSYAFNGIHDTGWLALNTNAVSTSGLTVGHFLGAIPSQVDVFTKRNADDNVEHNPTVKLAIQHADIGGGTAWAAVDVPIPAIKFRCDTEDFTIRQANPIAGSDVLFHEADTGTAIDNDATTHSVRVIVRR